MAAGRAVPVRYNGSVARLNFGPVSAARVRRWLARRRLRRAAHPRAGHPEPLPARAVGRAGADRGDLPHLEPALAGDAGRLPAAAAEPGEDLRPDRGLARTPGARWWSTSAATRWSSRTGCTSTRFAARPARARLAGQPGAADRRLRRAYRRAAQGAAGARARRCRRCWRAYPGAALPRGRAGRWRDGRAGGPAGAARAAVEFLGPGDDEERRRCCGRSTCTSPRTPAGELRHRPGRGDERGHCRWWPATSAPSAGCSTTGTSACCSRPVTRRPSPGRWSACSTTRAARHRIAADASAAVRRYDWPGRRAGAHRVRDGTARGRPGGGGPTGPGPARTLARPGAALSGPRRGGVGGGPRER